MMTCHPRLGGALAEGGGHFNHTDGFYMQYQSSFRSLAFGIPN